MTKNKRSGKKGKALARGMAATLVLAGCGGRPDSSSGSGNEGLSFDTRGLTPQQYSIANLTAVDDYGRTVEICDPSDAEKKYVGLFYFAWLGSQNNMEGIYDISKLEKLGADSPLYDPHDTTGSSPAHEFHFASEPLYGYYSMKDPWIIARHVELLTMAGIDYVLLDYTNAVTYNDVAELLLETLRRFKDQGWDVPGVGFYTNTGTAATVRNVYETFYRSGKYDDLWFRFNGDSRPVIVGASTANGGASDQKGGFLSTDSEEYKYFNFYESQWPSTGVVNDEKGLPWLQWGTPVPNLNGNISVSVAQHSSASPYFSEQRPSSSRGFDGSEVQEEWWLGQNFQWQWDNALQYDRADMVSNIFVTGWNEWTAIKYITGDGQGGANSTSGWTGRDVFFVDGYNAEYSRDIEMGREFGDSFYLQLVSNTRKFKFNEASRYRMDTRTISDLSDLSVWRNVFVEYADFSGDAMARDGENAAKDPHVYVDNSNRNDIVTIKVIHDDEYVWFYVETAEDITVHEDGDTTWMNLLISAGDTSTSFAGFNYIINRNPGADGKTSVEKCSEAGFHWTNAGEAEYFVSGNKIVYQLPLSVLGMNPGDVQLSFKVTDNVRKADWMQSADGTEGVQETGTLDILDYYITGDSAPIGRFGYAYGK